MCMCMCVALAFSKPNPDRKGFLCRWSAQLDPHCAWSTAISLDVKCIIPHLSFMKASGGYRTELNRTGSTAWENVFCKYRTGCEQSFQNNLGYRTTYQWCQMTIHQQHKKKRTQITCLITQDSNETNTETIWSSVLILWSSYFPRANKNLLKRKYCLQLFTFYIQRKWFPLSFLDVLRSSFHWMSFFRSLFLSFLEEILTL